MTETATCAACHRVQVTKTERAVAHMPVREGKMECSSCHNPHGSDNVKMLRVGNSIAESCASCHAEKRGQETVAYPNYHLIEERQVRWGRTRVTRLPQRPCPGSRG